MSETETETARCEACGARIAAGTEECPECGNAPGDFVTNVGVGIVFVGGAATTVSIPAGVAIVAVGVIVAGLGRFRTFEASEWDLKLN
ncbi:MAG: hypothetical protein U5J64_02685 [Halobacteriales archaeon]|nr:hypothetical protein [Halobacteriales archaeon]